MSVVGHIQAMLRKDVIANLARVSNLTVKNKKGQTAYDVALSNQAFDDVDLLCLLKTHTSTEEY